MSDRGDQAVDRAADALARAAESAAARESVPDKVAEELRADALFLRKLKPSLIVARLRGEATTDAGPEPPAAPSGPQLGKRSSDGGGANPLLIVGAALVVGVVLARVVDWRSHAHPRR